MEVLSSAATLASASANSVTITALVKNAANNGMADTAVSFVADSGVLQSVAATTDANGAATATLATGANRANRDIRVTVTAGTITGSVVLPVTGTALSLVGVGSVLVAGTTTYTATLRDSGGNAISGSALTVSSSLGNNVSPTGLTTDVNGSATFNYVANNAGNDVLTVSGGGASTTLAVAVSGEDFAVVSPSAGTEVFVNSSREVRVRYRSAGAGVAGQTVNFSTTRGTVSVASVLTDANGEAAVNLVSATAGPATVTAQMGGGALTSVALLFTAATPDSVVLQINPSAVQPNASGSSTNRAQLQAVVRDASGNPVKGRTVNFTLVTDTSGGRLGTGTGTTDANGTISDTFISGPLSTAADGVQIRATVAGTSVQSTAALTVSNQALFIAIATSNTIANKDETVYSKPFSLRVTDANGAAVRNQSVVLSVFPTVYYKGNLSYSEDDGAWGYNMARGVQGCVNEDRDRNGILGPNEDTNRDGRLTPGMPGVIPVATVTTDDTGFASFAVEYGEQYAPWVEFEITARASVAGTESSSKLSYLAGGVAGDFTSKTPGPAGQWSPFGTVLDCTVAN
ncbi:Ig-like domain-containing protein [Pseudorhodoferax soli]|uniref:Ig-like domain-containing protein n=1 Tax=Pseudorhodoferax soli TaxID=545864 RepID=UPI001FE7E39C|nr:Ig-like domain-containing protein [Pseudorhodoferax soli]